MSRLDEIEELYSESKYKELYDLCIESLKVKKDADILFYKCVADFSFSKQNLDQDLIDIKYVIKHSKKFKYAAERIYITLLGNLQMFEELSKVGYDYLKDIFKNAPEILDGFTYFNVAIAKTDFNNPDYKKAIEIIDEGLENTDDFNEELYSLKVDCLCLDKRIEEARNVLLYIQNHFGVSGSFYFQKARFAELEGYYDEALSYLDFAENYNYTPDFIFEARYRIATFMDDEKLVKKVISENNSLNSDLACSYLVRFYYTKPSPNIFKALRTAYNFIKENNDSYETLDAFVKIIRYEYFEECQKEKLLFRANFLKPYITKLVLIDSNNENVSIFNYIYILLHDNLNAYSILKNIYDKNKNSELGIKILQLMYFTDIDYDTIEKHSLECFENATYDYLKYYGMNVDYLSDLSSIIFIKNLITKKKFKKLNSEELMFLFKINLFGTFNHKINYKKALKYSKSIKKDEEKDPENIFAIGYFYENVLEDYNKAYSFYQKAYEIDNREYDGIIRCSYAHIAHCLYVGHGVSKDPEKAKKMIIDAINDKFSYKTSREIYLYCYFAIKGEEGFSLETAKESLEIINAFPRYDIIRNMYYKIILNKLNLDDSIAIKGIKNALSVDEPNLKKFYHKHYKDENFYPINNGD